MCTLKKLIFFTRNVILLGPSFIGSKRMTGIMWKERDYDPGGVDSAYERGRDARCLA